MKLIKISCWMLLAFFTGGSHAQTTPSGFDGPTPIRFLDQMLPVITMEQHYSGPTRLQGYRVRIYKNGSGYYDGLKNVRILGQQDFRIEPEQLQAILGDFKKYKFWEIPEDQLGGGHPFAVLALTFTLRDGVKYKSVRFAGQNHAVMLQYVIESLVGTTKWRCPFVDDRNQDLCINLDRDFDRISPNFLKFDLPRLQETYK